MCYGDKAFHIPACDKPVPVIDCGQDDYWNPDPAPGSYLDLHANVARSRFLGPQPQDALSGLPVASLQSHEVASVPSSWAVRVKTDVSAQSSALLARKNHHG